MNAWLDVTLSHTATVDFEIFLCPFFLFGSHGLHVQYRCGETLAGHTTVCA